MSEQESMTEKELAEVLRTSLYSDEPRSVGEALAQADEVAESSPPEVDEAPEGTPLVVTDEPVQPEPPQPEEHEQPQVVEPEPAEEGEPLEDEADPNVVWATKKYGNDPAKWAKAAYDQEQHISRLAGEKKEAEELATQWYEYSQQVEANQPQAQMPLTSQEEAWADQAMQNPVQYALQAVFNGNMGLYNAIIERVAYQDPRQASAVETEVRLAVMAAASEEEANGAEPDLQVKLAEAVQRAGIDVPQYGHAMMEKISELGEYHPYVQTILEGDDGARDIALMAVLDMVRSSSLSTRKVRDGDRDDKIRREAQLRKEAAGVVTGGGSRNPKQPGNPMIEAMQKEWEARGQWSKD